MSALIAYSGHSLWQQTFKGLHHSPEGKVDVFSKLPEFKDFLHQVDSKLLLLELSHEEILEVPFEELSSLQATKVLIITDKDVNTDAIDQRVKVLHKPVEIETLKSVVGEMLSELD